MNADHSVPVMEPTKLNDQVIVDLDEVPTANGETAQTTHGAFSSCTCTRCMVAAKAEVEKRFKDEAWTSNYVNKLQAQVERLELENEHMQRRRRRYSSSTCSTVSLDDIDRIMEVPPPQGPQGKDRLDLELPAELKLSLPQDKPGELKLDIKRRRKIKQKYGESKIERDDDLGATDLGASTMGAEHVLTVTREFDRKKHFWRRLVDIISPAFLDVLRNESQYDVDLNEVDGTLCLHDPLMLLFHNRRILNKFIERTGYASDSDDVKQARAHTKVILDFMRKELAESKVLDELESTQPSGLIEFSNIWLLYPPGTTVYSKENGEFEAFVVDSVRGVRKSLQHRSGQHTYSRLELTCWNINYDGEVFGRVWSKHEIYPFKGKKEIRTLDLIPEKFVPDAESVKSSLKARGKQFWALQGQQYREYTGEVWSQHMSEDSIRVMVDHLTYQRRENWPISINNKKGPEDAVSKNWREDRFRRNRPPPPDWDEYERRGRRSRRQLPPPLPGDDGRDYSPDRDCDDDQGFQGEYVRTSCDRPAMRGDSKFKRYDLLQPDQSEPDDLALLLCPQQVHGFCLRDKIWKSLNVTQLQPVHFRKNAWERLVLDEEYKDIVQAMVASYVDKTAKLEDIVAGKGAGLVALLHGPPGTGKTLTAECVADSFEKPLYQVTCGDIGTHPHLLEEKLDEIFDYAVTWGAILLLDEADVFLQERDYLHLDRNALVSIFLRTLEYFNGILFLTTNRIGTFDQAFQSRVHVTLGLPSLDQPRRAEVWEIFLDDLSSRAIVSPEQRIELQTLVRDKWSQEPLNGRQIRNAVRTAMLVAEKKRETPSRQHFETVLKIARDFEQYMGALRPDPDLVAERKGERLAGYEGFQEVERP